MSPRRSSAASSFHGIPRSTQDADVVVQIGEEDVPDLVAGGDRLDVAYLLRIAKLRGVERLLRRACAEAEVSLEPQ